MTKPATKTPPVRAIVVTLSHEPGLKSLRGVPVLVVDFYPPNRAQPVARIFRVTEFDN